MFVLTWCWVLASGVSVNHPDLGVSECCCILFCLGFTTQQSEVIVSALVKIMNTNLDMIYKDMVTKVQQVRSETMVGLK